MRRAVWLAAAAAVVLMLPACAQQPASREPHIVVTTNILGDVTREVLGDQARVTTLMQPNADPHSFEISARDAAMLTGADLVVSNGLGLEEGLQRHLDAAAAGGAAMLAAGTVVDVLPYRSGDASGTPDPHFWTDPATMLDVVDALEESAREIDGIDAGRLAASADAYRDLLAGLEQEMAASSAALPAERRALVTNHHVFGYLAERFDFRVVGAVVPGGTTLAAPSAADLQQLSQAIRDAGVPAIFADSSQPGRLVQVLADEAGINVQVIELFTESLTGPDGGAATYLDMMRENTRRIVHGLA